MGHEENVVPMVEAKVAVPMGSVGPEIEGPFLEEMETPPSGLETPA